VTLQASVELGAVKAEDSSGFRFVAFGFLEGLRYHLLLHNRKGAFKCQGRRIRCGKLGRTREAFLSRGDPEVDGREEAPSETIRARSTAF